MILHVPSRRRANRITDTTQRPPKPREMSEDTNFILVIGMITASGHTSAEIAERAHEAGYRIAASTIENWLRDGSTVRRPHSYSIDAVLVGLGYHRPILPLGVMH